MELWPHWWTESFHKDTNQESFCIPLPILKWPIMFCPFHLKKFISPCSLSQEKVKQESAPEKIYNIDK